MKYILLISTIFFIACNNLETKETLDTETYGSIDSIIGKSEQNLTIATGANQKSDSLVTGKIDKTVQKIANLENQVASLQNEVKKLKTENNELKANLDAAYDDGNGYNIRAISDY
jgi:septal ring factor EnvC (AmiA/AmiB activator)